MTENVARIAAAGDRLATLEAIRDRLAQDVDDCTDERALPNLVLRLTDVLNQIDQLPLRVPTAPADVIAARRRARRAAQRGATG